MSLESGIEVLESIIHDHIIAFLSDKNIFSTQQHGFTYQKSCFTNLLETFEDWTTLSNQGYSIDVVFLDFKKPLIVFHTKDC